MSQPRLTDLSALIIEDFKEGNVKPLHNPDVAEQVEENTQDNENKTDAKLEKALIDRGNKRGHTMTMAEFKHIYVNELESKEKAE